MQGPTGGLRARQAVGSLVSLLSALGVTSPSVPSADAFRRAKRNADGDKLKEEFMDLLFNILCKAEVISCGGQETQGPATRWQYVAAGLSQTGYMAEWMVSREEKKKAGGVEPEEEESVSSRELLLAEVSSRELLLAEMSSRELLLAVGWLLGGGVLDTVMTNTLHIDTNVLKITSCCLNQELLLSEHQGALQLQQDVLRRLQWLLGVLRFNSSTLMSMTLERATLLHVILSSSRSSSSSSGLHHHNSSLRKQCVVVQELCDLLESYMKWKQHEPLFWTWMDSVLDCCLTDRGEAGQPSQPANRSVAVRHHGNRGLQRLDVALLAPPMAQREAPLLQAYRARLQSSGSSPAQSSGSSPAQRPPAGASGPGRLQASQASRTLQQTEARLQDMMDRQRRANRTQLQDMISRLEHVVLIPP